MLQSMNWIVEVFVSKVRLNCLKQRTTLFFLFIFLASFSVNPNYGLGVHMVYATLPGKFNTYYRPAMQSILTLVVLYLRNAFPDPRI